MEYSATTGTPVVSVEAGCVISARPYGEYGNAIIVDHGAGLRTLYGRVDGFAVSEGDCVPAGAVIGRVGAPSGGGEPTLHFEVSPGGEFIWPIPPRGSIDPRR
jgi:murein DD-endopeptidase MepM/ murein hydrolase activator NlpD